MVALLRPGFLERIRGRRLRIAIRMTGLVALAILFVRTTGLLPRTLESISTLSLSSYGLGLTLYAAALVANAFRVRLLVRATGHSIPVAQLLSDLIESTGLNALIVMGTGEVYRVSRLRGRGLGVVDGSAVVLADRSSGLLVIAAAAVLGAGALGVESIGWAGRWEGMGPGLLLLAGISIAVGFVFGRWAAARWAPNLLPFFTDLRTLVGLAFWSLVILACWIGSVAAYSRALGLELDLAVIAFAAPLVSLATLLPVSVAGLGVREASYALLLAPYGVTTNEAVALGLIQYSGFLLTAGLAFGLLLVERFRHPDSEPESGAA